MASYGFDKLKAILAKKGLKNPAGAAAEVGRAKYGAKAMKQAAAQGKPLKESQALKKVK